MKLFFIEGTLTGLPIEKADFKARLKEHLDYLDKGVAEGWIIMVGPKTDGQGGAMVVKADNADMVEDYLANDPFKFYGIQTYRLVEFECGKYNPL
jgi:uncharacterized protein YciI